MTAFLTLLWVGAISQNQDLAAPLITNPLPVLKGQIGRGQNGTGKTRSAPLGSGYSPLNPALLPGVSFALKSLEASEPVTQSSPSSQGPNAAFDSALDQLFGKGAPMEEGAERGSASENEATLSSEGIALPVSPDQEENL